MKLQSDSQIYIVFERRRSFNNSYILWRRFSLTLSEGQLLFFFK